MRTGETGIAVSHCALGDGVNAENIKKCLAVLRDHDYTGVLLSRGFRDALWAVYDGTYAFPEALQGKYQSYTQADLARLRGAGYEGAFRPVEQGVADYVRELLKGSR